MIAAVINPNNLLRKQQKKEEGNDLKNEYTDKGM